MVLALRLPATVSILINTAVRRLREERERERRERLEAEEREVEREAARVGESGAEGWDPFRRA
jgi:hypothetical protein